MINSYTQHLCEVQMYILLIHFTCIHDGWTISLLLRIPPFFFFFLKNFESQKFFFVFFFFNDTMLHMKGHVCDIEHIICILCKNAYGHFAILVTRNIYANVKLHFYNRENVSYELFYKKLFILSYYRQRSQHLCFMYMSMGGSTFIFICSHFLTISTL